MSDIAISVENLGKAYRIGLKEEIPDSLTSAAIGWVKAPFRNFRQLRRLNTFDAGSDVNGNGGGNGQADQEDIIWALKGVSFEVRSGEVVGIIGRNGAGKSTLLKILSRITEPTTGKAVIRGRVSSLLEVGTGFHPELSGRENIYMNGTILGMRKKEIDGKFDEIVDFAGVERFLDTPVKRYSSGMKVRLGFAVAAHLEPEILVIDEVLAVGDAEFQRKCLGKMHDVAGSGRTVLFVSHNMAAVQNLCHRVVVIHAGVAVYDGDTDSAIARYLRPVEGAGRTIDLSTIARRAGLQPVLREVRLLDANGERVQAMPAGAPLTIAIYFEHSQAIRQPRFGIAVEDVMGQRLFFLQTDLQYGQCPDLNAIGRISCHVPSVPLVPGRYYISIGCASRGTQLDSVDRACFLDVTQSDVFGTGQLPSKTNGMFLVNAIWDISTTRTRVG